MAGGRKVPSVAWLLKRLAIGSVFRDLVHRIGGSPLSAISQSVTPTLTAQALASLDVRWMLGQKR